MKKNIELTYSNKATINTGDYNNINPMYAEKIIIEGVENINEEEEFTKIKRLIDKLINQDITNIKQKLLADKLKQFRFYEKDGKKYISVTTVLNPEPFTSPNIELGNLRGKIKHEQLAKYIKTGVLDQVISEEIKKKLEPIGGMEGYDLSWIAENEDIDLQISEQVVFNDEFMYAGRYDAKGKFMVSRNANYDLKTGSLDKQGIEKAFIQLSAYAMCPENKGVDTLVILPCSPKYKKEPIVSQEIEKYFDMFKQLRAKFKERHGI